MVSKRSLGMKYEREFEALLNEKGYTTQRVKGSTKFNKNVDFFGKWDILGFNQNEWILVQVKTDYRKKVHADLQDWMTEKSPPETIGMYAIRKKGVRGKEKWKIVIIFPKKELVEEEAPEEIKQFAGMYK